MKTYTPEALAKLSDRQLRRLAAKPDYRLVIVGYPKTDIAYPNGEPVLGKTNIVEEMEWLHTHVRNEQLHRKEC